VSGEREVRDTWVRGRVRARSQSIPFEYHRLEAAGARERSAGRYEEGGIRNRKLFRWEEGQDRDGRRRHSSAGMNQHPHPAQPDTGYHLDLGAECSRRWITTSWKRELLHVENKACGCQIFGGPLPGAGHPGHQSPIPRGRKEMGWNSLGHFHPNDEQCGPSSQLNGKQEHKTPTASSPTSPPTSSPLHHHHNNSHLTHSQLPQLCTISAR
jgi:hypothetical protein